MLSQNLFYKHRVIDRCGYFRIFLQKMHTNTMSTTTTSNGIPKLGAVDSIIERIRNGAISKIVTLSGAGISVASGIPDFRSPGGGFYATLRPELLTATKEHQEAMRYEPTLVVDWQLFRVNSLPYLEVRRPFILGTAAQQWKPTLAHFFIGLLHAKGLLQRNYTQNIDGLDHQIVSEIPIPREKTINVHGSLAHISCEFCGKEQDGDLFQQRMRSQIRNIYDASDAEAPATSTPILCDFCHRPGVKPSTVLFGRNLPKSFFQASKIDFPHNTDLLLILGTSLCVSPANSLVQQVAQHVPRLVINRERVGEELGIDYRDSENKDGLLLGDCDEMVVYMAKQLGWLADLAVYRSHMCPSSQALLDSHIPREIEDIMR